VEWGHQALADRIMAAKLPDGFTLRNIDRAKWSGLTDRKTIEDALAWLEDSGWIRAIETRSKRAADLPPPAIRST